MTEPERLVERRRRLARADIGRVAINLFADRGFDAVTVDDIAAAAGISQRTFFRYFATKDEVVLDYERTLYDRLVAVVADRPTEEGPVTALRRAYQATSQVAPEDREYVVQLGRILAAAPDLRATVHGARSTSNDELIELIAARMGVPTDDARPRVVVAAMTAVAAAEWAAWVEGGGAGDPAERIGSALALVEQGLDALDGRPVQGETRSA
ncbi:MAG TPA: TetR family transcriptional regulator [Acidimicrobiales bacterium]|nr:TetR family transcriptional regulator [Acidimicrobiales bacterium]